MPRKKPTTSERPALTFANQARDLKTKINSEFQQSIDGIARHIAQHEGAEVVSAPHVAGAYETLCRAGIRRQKFIDRPETYQAVAGFSIGASTSCPELIKALFPPVYANAWANGSMLILVIFGVSVYAIGAAKSHYAAFDRTTKLTYVWRSLLVVFSLALTVYTAYVVYGRLTGSCCGGSGAPTAAQSAELSAQDGAIIVEGHWPVAPAPPAPQAPIAPSRGPEGHDPFR